MTTQDSPTTGGVSANVSTQLSARAAENPARVAVRGSDGREIAFGDLDERCDRIAAGLRVVGLAPGDRACLFVHPGPELIALTHALFRARIVPVLIDPGMGRRNLLASVERMQPRGLVGVPRAQVARILFPRAFRSVEISVTVGPRMGWGGYSLAGIERRGARSQGDLGAVRPDDPAAILFTSGSTGPPKGVLYTHRMFSAQLTALQQLYDLRPGEIDVACFPLFALFDNALGITSVFPDLDPSRPASCDPNKIVRALEESGASFTFGSPAIWRRVLPYMQERGQRFSALRRITIAGAPVPPALIAGLRALLPAGGDVFTPYGATEALPVASLSGAELDNGIRARALAGEGTCVGHPAPGIAMRLIRVTDDPLPTLEAGLEVAPGELGEVCVRGDVVTHQYAEDPGATALAKLREGEHIWHRMGDLGRFDDDGRLWFLGRKSHRLETADGLRPCVPAENVFNTVPGVHRTALVGVGPRGNQVPTLVVETENSGRGGVDRAELTRRLRACGAGVPACAGVGEVLFHPRFPVDVRHNAKIHRGELARWAAARRR